MTHHPAFRYILSLLILALLTVRCADQSADISADNGTGIGGSLARFVIKGNYLYTIDFSTLRYYDISQPATPVFKKEIRLDVGVETIFPLEDWLFLGTQWGMLIYRVADNGEPEYVSTYSHVRSCDPVVANSEFAYVTLRANGCNAVNGNFTDDRLEIISLANIQQPQILAEYQMEEPWGMGLDDNWLFVCDGQFGLKMYDVTNSQDIQLVQHITTINARDAIALNGLLLVIGPDSVYQYDYSQPGTLVFVSQLPFGV